MSLIFQKKNFNMNWELNLGPLALSNSMQNHYSIQIQVPGQFKMWKIYSCLMMMMIIIFLIVYNHKRTVMLLFCPSWSCTIICIILHYNMYYFHFTLQETRTSQPVPPGPSSIENDAHGIEKLLLKTKVSLTSEVKIIHIIVQDYTYNLYV